MEGKGEGKKLECCRNSIFSVPFFGDLQCLARRKGGKKEGGKGSTTGKEKRKGEKKKDTHCRRSLPQIFCNPLVLQVSKEEGGHRGRGGGKGEHSKEKKGDERERRYIIIYSIFQTQVEFICNILINYSMVGPGKKRRKGEGRGGTVRGEEKEKKVLLTSSPLPPHGFAHSNRGGGGKNA